MEIPESEPGVTQARKLPGLQRESITKLHLEGGAAKSKNLSLAHSGQEVAEFTLQTLEIVPRAPHDRKPYVFTRASYLTLVMFEKGVGLVQSQNVLRSLKSESGRVYERC